MRFKLDENLPQEAAGILNSAGHDAVTVISQNLAGQHDDRIINVCHDESRVLLTLDLDFADIVRYPPEQFSGIVVLRLQIQDGVFIQNLISRLLPLMAADDPSGHLWIVNETTVRIRPQP